MYHPPFSPPRLLRCLLLGTAASLLLALAGPALAPRSPIACEMGEPRGPTMMMDLYRARTLLCTHAVGCCWPYGVSGGDSIGAASSTVRHAKYSPAAPGTFGMESQHMAMPEFELFDSGWPMRSLAAFRTGSAGFGASPAVRNEDRRGWISVGDPMSPTVIPVYPHPAALAINALAWTAILWLTAQLSLRGLGAIRHHYGHCPRCAYDRRGLPPSTPCPECGQRH